MDDKWSAKCELFVDPKIKDVSNKNSTVTHALV